jgi:thioredoxin reductase (NADPH)
MTERQSEEREIQIVGRRSSPHIQEYRDFLERNDVSFRWVDLDRDPLVHLLLGSGATVSGMPLPFFLFEDGSRMDVVSGKDEQKSYTQTLALLAERVGLHVRPNRELYDLVIVGAGPAGLTAAVYAASEGLRTVLLEKFAPGGQAGTSARIENYPGFPDGVSGSAFAEGALRQAIRLGAEVLVGCDFVSIGPESDGIFRLVLVNGAVIRARAGIGATGSHYRRLDVPGVENLIGNGIYYGAAPHEAFFHRDGLVYIVGGANSAGQAALHLAEYARAVTLVVRTGDLGEHMSHYLVERCEQHPRISIRTKSRVARAIGNGRLERLVIHDDASGTDTEVPADALFILIGGEPVSRRVADWLRLDDNGFYLTGSDLLTDQRTGPRWPLERQPFPLESSQPGVFVIGDARHGSVKRIASAVGEGALAVQFVHRYLESVRAVPAPALRATDHADLAVASIGASDATNT